MIGDVGIELNDGSPFVLRISGELDLSNIEMLDEALGRAKDAGKPVLVDLSECRFIDTTVLARLIRAARPQSNGRPRLAIVHPAPTISKLLALTGVDQTVPVVFTLEEGAQLLHRDSV